MSSGTDGEENNDRRSERKTEELFVENYNFMFATARKILKQKADAEDLIQSLFFKALGWDLPANVWEDPKGYLYRTVVNACFDWKDSRKSRKENQGVENLEMTSPRSGHAHDKAVDQIEGLLSGLDDGIAKIVVLHAESGYSDAEIAAMIGGSRSKVSMILTRAREKLRKIRRGSGLAGGPDAK